VLLGLSGAGSNANRNNVAASVYRVYPAPQNRRTRRPSAAAARPAVNH